MSEKTRETPETAPSDLDDRPTDVPASDTERLRAELQEVKDRLVRTAAELENFRKRSRRELQEQRQYAVVPLMQGLLPVVDNLRRAVEASEQEADFDSLAQGVRMVLTQFDQVLVEYGLSEIETIGQPFDPHVHEAANQQPSEKHPAGTVSHVMQKGYCLHDRIVRPATVVVSSGSPSEQSPTASNRKGGQQMVHYIIIENEAGLTVAEVPAGQTAEDAAAKLDGTVVDPGPYETFDDAYDAMQLLPEDEMERAKLRD